MSEKVDPRPARTKAAVVRKVIRLRGNKLVEQTAAPKRETR